MVTAASPEFDFLVGACLGRFAVPGAALASGLDWDAVFELATRHRVEALVGLHITQQSLAVPDHVRDLFRQAQRAQTLTALAQTGETIRLTELAAAKGWPLIVLKGAPLAHTLYAESPTARQSIDIDLLVAPANFTAVEAELLDAGYTRSTPRLPLPPGAQSMARHLLNANEYEHGDLGFKVELHHRLLLDPHALAVSFEDLFARSNVVAVGGVELRSLGERDQPAYLCCHAAGHLFFRMKWLVDLVRVFESLGQTGIAATLQHARKVGCERPVVLTLALIETLTGRAYAALDPASRHDVAPLVRRCVRALHGTPRDSDNFRMRDVGDDMSEMLFGLRLASSWRSRGFKILQHLSNHEDINTLQLGRTWAPVYAVLGRPLAFARWLRR